MRQYGYQGDDGIGEALGIDHFPGHYCPSCGHETPLAAVEDGDYDYDYICENAGCSDSPEYDTGSEEE